MGFPSMGQLVVHSGYLPVANRIEMMSWEQQQQFEDNRYWTDNDGNPYNADTHPDTTGGD